MPCYSALAALWLVVCPLSELGNILTAKWYSPSCAGVYANTSGAWSRALDPVDFSAG